MSTAELRGWGPGWPTNRRADMRLVQAKVSGAKWWVHHELQPLIQWLVDEVERRGYLFDHGPADVDDDWGFANRPIGGTSKASEHSRGIAIDFDAQEYPLGSKRRAPQWIYDLFYAYGFAIGADWDRPDPMHVEFRGSVTEARFLIAALAASHIANQPPVTPPLPPPSFPSPKEEDDMYRPTFLVIEDPPQQLVDRYGPGCWYLTDGIEARPISSYNQALRLWDLGLAPGAVIENGEIRPKSVTFGVFNGTRINPFPTAL